MTDHWWWK